MVFFRINGKALARNPTSVEQKKTKIQNTDRTIDGTLVVDLIAIKDTVEFNWEYMSDRDMQILMAELEKGVFCEVEYYDTKSKTASELTKITALAGDISYAPHYDYASQSIMWKGVKVDFQER